MAGPAAAIATLLPTKRPAPMMPPMVIIETWRGRRERLSSFGWTPVSFIGLEYTGARNPNRGSGQGLATTGSSEPRCVPRERPPPPALHAGKAAQKTVRKTPAHEHCPFD